jgi:hypothetical protein
MRHTSARWCRRRTPLQSGARSRPTRAVCVGISRATTCANCCIAPAPAVWSTAPTLLLFCSQPARIWLTPCSRPVRRPLRSAASPRQMGSRCRVSRRSCSRSAAGEIAGPRGSAASPGDSAASRGCPRLLRFVQSERPERQPWRPLGREREGSGRLLPSARPAIGKRLGDCHSSGEAAVRRRRRATTGVVPTRQRRSSEHRFLHRRGSGSQDAC